MKLSLISDVHIQVDGDSRSELLNKFFNNEKVQNSDKIILLGDIFDVIAGDKKEYSKLYKSFFSIISKKEIADKLIYFEGNHDVHLENLFKFLNEKNNTKIRYEKKAIDIILNGKKCYISHGDDIEFDNGFYHSWRNILDSIYFKIFIKLVPFKVIEYIGDSLSRKSKKHNGMFYNTEKNKQKFRRSAKQLGNKGYDLIVCGHSHVKDKYNFDTWKGISTYINNGYAPATKSFIYINEEGAQFIDL